MGSLELELEFYYLLNLAVMAIQQPLFVLVPGIYGNVTGSMYESKIYK
jgi:hypothetical protein